MKRQAAPDLRAPTAPSSDSEPQTINSSSDLCTPAERAALIRLTALFSDDETPPEIVCKAVHALCEIKSANNARAKTAALLELGQAKTAALLELAKAKASRLDRITRRPDRGHPVRSPNSGSCENPPSSCENPFSPSSCENPFSHAGSCENPFSHAGSCASSPNSCENPSSSGSCENPSSHADPDAPAPYGRKPDSSPYTSAEFRSALSAAVADLYGLSTPDQNLPPPPAETPHVAPQSEFTNLKSVADATHENLPHLPAQHPP